MAEELGSVEMLQSDFVNTFSHEFKTPLISIRGFAKLLQNPDISGQQRAIYAGTIARESERLAAMSTHILELTQFENTEIVSGKTLYSLDEQLRRVHPPAGAELAAEGADRGGGPGSHGLLRK